MSSQPPSPERAAAPLAPQLPWYESLFGHIKRDVRLELESLMRPIILPRGETLFHTGDEPAHLFVLDHGRLKLSRRADPQDQRRESLLRIIAEGQVFGELSLLDPGPRTTTATAITACDLRALSRKDFFAVVKKHPSLAIGLAHQLAHRLRFATDYATDLVLNDVHGRTARTLVHLAEMFGTRDDEGVITVAHGLTQQEIAHMVGASRESVNKILMEFTDAGQLALSHRTFTVFDEPAIRAQAEASYPGRLPRD